VAKPWLCFCPIQNRLRQDTLCLALSFRFSAPRERRRDLIEPALGPFFVHTPRPPSPATSTMSRHDTWRASWLVSSPASLSVCGRRVVSKSCTRRRRASCSSLPLPPHVSSVAPSHPSLSLSHPLFPTPIASIYLHTHSGNVVTRSKCSAWFLKGKKGKKAKQMGGVSAPFLFSRPVLVRLVSCEPTTKQPSVSVCVCGRE